jgi:hypothetical protein
VLPGACSAALSGHIARVLPGCPYAEYIVVGQKHYLDRLTAAEGQLQRDAYWAWFSDHWNADKVVKVVEKVIGDGGRPRWIDYRVTLQTGETLHLHIVAAVTTTLACSPTTSSAADGGTGSGS